MAQAGESPQVKVLVPVHPPQIETSAQVPTAAKYVLAGAVLGVP